MFQQSKFSNEMPKVFLKSELVTRSLPIFSHLVCPLNYWHCILFLLFWLFYWGWSRHAAPRSDSDDASPGSTIWRLWQCSSVRQWWWLSQSFSATGEFWKYFAWLTFCCTLIAFLCTDTLDRQVHQSNNQPNNGVSGGGFVGDETRQGGTCVGGVLPVVWRVE